MSVRIFGSGGGVITDATATPEDVLVDQVFYNNDGRQVGTYPGKRMYSVGGVCESGTHISLGYKNSAIYPSEGSFSYDTGTYTLTGFKTTYTTYPGFGYPTSMSQAQSSTYKTAMWALEIQRPLSFINSIKAGSLTIIMGLTSQTTNNIYITNQLSLGHEINFSGKVVTDTSNPVYCGIMIGNGTLYRIIICQQRNISGGNNFGDYGMYLTSDIPVTCYYTD